MNATKYRKLFLLAVMVIVAQVGVWGQGTPVSSLPKLTYTSNTSFTVPQGVYSLTLEAWGGGGGGGRATRTGTVCGGGGGGAYAKCIVGVNPGDILTIEIGEGGEGGDNNKDGKPSYILVKSSLLYSSNTKLVEAVGGKGVSNNNLYGGEGGQSTNCTFATSSVGRIVYSGGKGGDGSTGRDERTAAGGGGGGAGSGIGESNGNGTGKNGSNGVTASSGIMGGTGGAGGKATSENGGNGGTGAGYNGKGAGGNNYGGGGGGAKRGSSGLSSTQDGGSGAQGLVRISFPSSPTIDLFGTTSVCQGNQALKATAPHPVRSVAGWEWILSGQTSGVYTNTPAFTTENLNPGSYTYYVRAHYENVIWNGTPYTWLYDDSQNTANFTVIVIPEINNKTVGVCSGDPFEVIPSAAQGDKLPAVPIYTWAVPTMPAGVTGATAGSQVTSIQNTLINSTDTPQTVVYTVTPQSKTGDCLGNAFTITVTVYPEPKISDKKITICSGESIDDYDPAVGTAFAGELSYTWTLATQSHPGAIISPPQSGLGTVINTGELRNTSVTDATLYYTVTPRTATGCDADEFTLEIEVHPELRIVDPGNICSGVTQPLEIEYANGTIFNHAGGTFSSSDTTIAQVDASGNLTTDVDASEEGKGGDVTITYTSTNGCIATRTITITPRTPLPEIRWDFNETCPIDDGEEDYAPSDSLNIATPWNITDTNRVYFENHIVWDSLVVVNDPIENVESLRRIKWYSDKACAPEHLIRYGKDPLPNDGRMANFWQNEDHEPEVYWATVTEPGYCESKPREVRVYIKRDLKISVTNLMGYVQPPGTAPLDLLVYLDLELDESQELLWYETEYDAEHNINEIPQPDDLDPTQETDETYWLVKADDYGCRSLPTEFKIKLVPMPTISITPKETLVCPRYPVEITVTMANGTAPYTFTITNMNTGDTQTETVDEGARGVFTFTTSPQVTVNRRITAFSDAFGDNNVIYGPYGLNPPAVGYFDQNTISVITTEITKITPNSGPTSGGIYTEDPESPINEHGTVIITGSGFKPFDYSAMPEVTFGGIPAEVITATNETITCIPPAHLSGNVTVAVTAVCTTATLTDGYRYEPINISDVTPDHGPVTGNTTVVIRGTGLLGVTGGESGVTVSIAGVQATVVSVSNIEITCTTDESSTSLVGDIVIHNGIESRVFPNMFTYYPVKFIENGCWSEPHKWETQIDHHILPYPGADVQIAANCVQDVDVDMNSITVHPGKAYTIGNGKVLNANDFTLQANASFLNRNEAFGGNMLAVRQNVEHTLTKGRNWYVSSPVEGGKAGPKMKEALGKDASGNNLIGAIGNQWRVQSYYEPDHDWLAEGADSLFYTGLGYTAYSQNIDIAVRFSGKYIDGDIETPFNVTRSGAHEKRGFNLVGNPFPSYWRWTAEAAEAANLYSTIWYRTQVGGVYQFWSYNASGDVAVAPGWEDATPTGSYSMAYVSPMQAFWVRLVDGKSSGILTFKDSYRAHADHPSNLFKSTRAGGVSSEIRPFLRLTADDGMSIDETVIYADTVAKADFDSQDSDKWFVNQGVEIFTLPVGSTRPLVINSLPAITDGTEIPIGFQADEGGAFCFHAKEILNMDTLHVYLVDKWRNNVEVDLRMYDYNFTSSSVPVTDRFSIVFRSSPITGLPDVIEEEGVGGSTGNELLAYSGNDGEIGVLLLLKNQEGNSEKVSVFDIAGRKLAEQSVVVGQRTILKNKFAEGAYILRAGKCAAKVLVSF